jgi:hypothetical protein
MSESDPTSGASRGRGGSPGLAARIVGAWALVGLPLAWGVWQVFEKSLDLFR